MNDMPKDPFTSLAEAATALHELYLAYIAAGFTEAQAMKLVTAIASGGMRES